MSENLDGLSNEYRKSIKEHAPVFRIEYNRWQLFHPQPSGVLHPNSTLEDHKHFAKAWGGWAHLSNQPCEKCGVSAITSINGKKIDSNYVPIPSGNVVMHSLHDKSEEYAHTGFDISQRWFTDKEPETGVSPINFKSHAKFYADPESGKTINTPNVKPPEKKSKLQEDMDFAEFSGGKKGLLSFAHGRGAHEGPGRNFSKNGCPDCKPIG